MWSEHYYLDKLQMAKSIFEQLGGAYEQHGDYFIPCLVLPAEKEKPVGIYGSGTCGI